MAEELDVTETRYGLKGANHQGLPKDTSNPYFTFDPDDVHRLLAMRARMRRDAGHVCADDPGSRIRIEGLGESERTVPRLGVRLVRRLRRGVPDGGPDRKFADQAWPAGSGGHDDLRVLRRRLLVRRRSQRRSGRPHGAQSERPRQPRPLVRQGAICVRLRDAPGPHHDADDSRVDQRSVAAGRRGTRRSATPPRNSGASRRNTAAMRLAASRRRAAPTKKRSWSRSWSAPRSATTTSTPARASATRPPATD